MDSLKLDYGVFSKDENYLVDVLKQALTCQVITNADKLRQFPPSAISEGYDLENELMEYVMQGLFPHMGKATIKKMIEKRLHTELIETALEARDVNEDLVFKLMPEEEMVRALNKPKSWQLVDDTKWYERDTPEHRQFAAFLLEQYIAKQLGSDDGDPWSKLVDGIGIDQLMLDNVPAAIRVAIIKCAYHLGKKGMPTTAQAILTIFPPKMMVKHIPLPVLMRPVRQAAVAFGWMDASQAPAPEATPTDGEDVPPQTDAGEDEEERPTGMPPRDKNASASGPPPLPVQRTPELRVDDDDAQLVEARINALITPAAGHAPEGQDPEVTTEGPNTGSLRVDLEEFEEEQK